MFGPLRQFARLLTGKVQPFELALGAFFGVLLALTPSRAVDEGTGFIGMSTLWLLLLFLFLALRASIPIALLLMGLFEIFERLFLGNLTSGTGRFLLESLLPQSFAIGLSGAWPSAQLHTWWGFGGLLWGIVLGLALAIPCHVYVKRRISTWREKYGQSKLVRAASFSLTEKAMSWWIG